MRHEQRVQDVLGDLTAGDEPVERRVLEELGLAQPLAHRVPLPDAEDDEPHVAALAGEDRVDGPVPVPDLSGREPGLDPRHRVGQRPVADLRDRLVHRHLHELARAGRLTLVQRAQEAERAGDRGRVVDQVSRWQQWRVLGDTGLEREAAAGGEGRVGGGPVGIGTVEAERRQRADHEVRVTGGQVARLEARRQVHAGGDEHVGVVEQLVEAPDVGLVGQVEHDAALPRVADRERQRHAAPYRRGPAPRRPARRLHLDDVGAEVPQESAGELAAVDGAVDDAESGQGQRLVAHPANLSTPGGRVRGRLSGGRSTPW